jgi:Alr-MurF fusion protein
MYAIDQLPDILSGQLIIQVPGHTTFEWLETDTRQLVNSGNVLFVALKGPFYDAHDYLQEAYDKGVRNFLVSQSPGGDLAEKANWYIVSDTLAALQDFAACHRKQFDIPVIGITGSNGKTWVKEWLFHLLSETQQIAKSPKSYNSQIGVPLSVWGLHANHTLGIFEAGISRPGEMVRLKNIIRPTIGLFTVLSDAHSSQFDTDMDKLREKWQLFADCHQIICCADQKEVAQIANSASAHQKVTSWTSANDPAATLRFDYAPSPLGSVIYYEGAGQKGQIEIPYIDAVSQWNAATCLAAIIAMDAMTSRVAERFKTLEPIGMRMELVSGKDQSILINDSYNADLEGLKKALHFQEAHGKDRDKWIVLSALLQSGKDTEERFRQIAQLVTQFEVSRVFAVGPEVQALQETLPLSIDYRHFNTTEELERHLGEQSFEKVILLFKGARKYKLDQICKSFEQIVHQTELEIHLDALRHNMEFFREKIQPNTRLIAVVKAAAYGIGSREIAKMLESVNVDSLAVAYTDEGIELRKSGVKSPIIVLNPDPSTFEQMLLYKLEPEIYTIAKLEHWIEVQRDSPYPAFIHLKLDTGMHRLGFEQEQIRRLTDLLKKNPELRIGSVMSHLASSENEEHDAFTHTQAGLFEEMYEEICLALGYRPDRHLLNSNGILRFPQYQYEAVRLGIGLYGVGVSTKSLRPVHRFVSRIAQIKHLDTGDTVGYSRSFLTENPIKMATINVGYADGIPRSAGKSNFKLWVKGYLCRIIGDVCMDMTMIDVTEVEGINEGDEVVIFGPEYNIDHISQAAHTIPYEILTGIAPRVKRRFIEE